MSAAIRAQLKLFLHVEHLSQLLRVALLTPERRAHTLQSRGALGISSPPAQLFSLSLQGLNYLGELCPSVKLLMELAKELKTIRERQTESTCTGFGSVKKKINQGRF